MKSLTQSNKYFLKNMNGFTFIELAIVSCLISILASISVVNYMPFKKKTFDSVALSDARNLVQNVMLTTISREDVDYTKLNTGGPVGNLDTSGNPRRAVYVLSSGVEAVIAGDSHQGPKGDTTIFLAIVYHTKGTDNPATLSGKREFNFSYNEATDTVVFPQ